VDASRQAALGAIFHGSRRGPASDLQTEESTMKVLSILARGASVGAIAGLMFLGSPALAGDNPQVAAEVMALARAQWASEIAGQTPAQQLVSVANDYTEFNGDYPTLLVGKDVASRMAAITPYSKAVYSDMQNGRVQVYGDTAILTYNFAGITQGADGKSKPAIAKSTRVYVREGGKWMLVHANFAPVQLPAQ
jgi:ketosteroid isomerase-like protein